MHVRISSTLFSLLLVLPAAAQEVPPLPSQDLMPRDLPMASTLWDLERGFASTSSLSDRQSLIDGAGFSALADGRINVEIVGPSDAQALDQAWLAGFDGFVDATWRHRTSAWLPVERLTALAQALPERFRLHAVLPPTPDEDPEDMIRRETKSLDYSNAGADGSGVTIAIIDSGYERLTTAQSSGDAPPDSRLTTVNYVTFTGIESGGKHGTACLETVYDSAPGADYVIYKTGNVTHFGNAVDDAVTRGVDIISHSMSKYNQGWDDGTGDACEAAKTATQNGILFCTSAGNRAQSHWQGDFYDSDGDGIHEFYSGDETINIELADGEGGNFYLSFDTAGGGSFDYDLYLYDSSLNVKKKSTGGTNTFEDFSFKNNSGSTETYHLVVLQKSGADTELEIFFHGARDFKEYQVTSSSTTSPSNTGLAGVLSCGAVASTSWASNSGATSIIQSYSSNGPSNGGMGLPDICGATGNYTVAYQSATKLNGSFGGTSCATPNVAGAAACFLSEFTNLAPEGLDHLLKELALVFKDWGATGTDYVYGHGGLYLHTYQASTEFVDRSFGAWTPSASPPKMHFPFYDLDDAQRAANDGGRMVVFAGNYPDTITLDKELDIEVIGGSAKLAH